MTEVNVFREELLGASTGREEFESRLRAFEDAVRCEERESTLSAIRHSLHTLRGLVAFLRQEVLECAGPLEKLCDELEREVRGAALPGQLDHIVSPD